MYKILSLDGGGLYGALTAILIDRLCSKGQIGKGSFLDQVDLIAGTSVGGIIAIGLAAGMTPGQIVELFETRTAEMFPKERKRTMLAYLGQKAFYPGEGRRKVLQDVLGDKKLNDLGKKVVVPAFELNNDKKQWGPKLFHNFSNPFGMGPLLKRNLNKTSKNLTAVDVAMATSAAPVYFPSAGRYIDGGVAQNNPAMAAIAQVLDPMCLLGVERPKLEDIVVLSIGNASEGDYVEGENVDMGYASWVKSLFSVFIHGDISTTDYQCRQFLGERYHKICPILPQKLNRSMDDLTLVPELIEYGLAMDLSETNKWLESNWK